MTEIQNIRISAFDYINDIPHDLWARYAFPEPRYGQDTSNINESLNHTYSDIRFLPPIQMLNAIYMKTMTMIYERRRKPQLGQVLADIPYQKYLERKEYSRRYFVLSSNDGLHQVQVPDTGVYKIVNLKAITCECTNFQEYRSPCAHAIAAIVKDAENPFDYFDISFYLEQYRKSYERSLPPVSIAALKKDGKTGPPIIIKKRGRPSTKRIRKQATWCKNLMKRRCGTCEQYGHDRRTCKNQPVESYQRQRLRDNLDSDISAIQEALEETDSDLTSAPPTDDEAEKEYQEAVAATVAAKELREKLADDFIRELDIQRRIEAANQREIDKERAVEKLRWNITYPPTDDPFAEEIEAQIMTDIAAALPSISNQSIVNSEADDEAELSAIVSPLKLIRKRKERVQALLRSPVVLRQRK